jgi:hypothetical protein
MTYAVLCTLGDQLDCMAVGSLMVLRSPSLSLTSILLSPPSPGGWRRGAGKQSSTWPPGRTSREQLVPAASWLAGWLAWQAHAVLVGAASIARLRTLPPALLI